MTGPPEHEIAQTAAGTPGGDFLRRFWQPIAAQSQLTEDNPIRPVRVLSEGLVLFHNQRGEVGLVQERCPHNGFPLADGYVAEKSLACKRHGWHFGIDGACWVVGYQDKIYPIHWARAKAYPVQTHAGLYWAYLGPGPAPALPVIEPLDCPDAVPRATIYPVLDRGWAVLAAEGMKHGASLLLPTHTYSESVCLRLPVDDSHTWQVVIEFASHADPVGATDGTEVIEAEDDAAVIVPNDLSAELAALGARWRDEIVKVARPQEPAR